MSPTIVRRLSLTNVIVNVAIIVSGGAVRLTGSGLGCPTWPNCQPGAFHATPEMGIHGYIEWGNRLFSVGVGFVAAATLLATLLLKPRRQALIGYALLVAIGVPTQAVIGLITVTSGLNPWVVSSHFLISIGILTAAYMGYARSREPDGNIEYATPPAFRALSWLVVAASLATIALGVLVTGSGPHAGDPSSPRIPLDPAMLAQVHVHAVFLLLGVTMAAGLAAVALKAPLRLRRALWWLLGIELAQGLIGFVQFATGLPVILVGAHMLAAAILWLFTVHLVVAGRRYLPADSDTASPFTAISDETVAAV